MHIDCLPCIFEHINRLWILHHSSQHQLILNKYIVSKFNVNIKLKLSVGWFKYVNIIKSNNNRVGKQERWHNFELKYVWACYNDEEKTW